MTKSTPTTKGASAIQNVPVDELSFHTEAEARTYAAKHCPKTLLTILHSPHENNHCDAGQQSRFVTRGNRLPRRSPNSNRLC